MTDTVIGFFLGVVVSLLFVVAIGRINDDKPITVKTAKPLKPMGMYIKVNPGGVNDTTYVYEVKPD